MRFAHIADSHLGYEQYNLSWRAEDFSRALKEVIEKCADVDFVLISGDLFHKSSPNPKTLKDSIEILQILKDKNIPVFTIEGNHDRSGREISAHHLLEKLELLNLLGFRKERVESDFVSSEKINGAYLAKGYYKDVEIVGCGFIRFKVEKYLQYLKTSQNKSILMLHQAVKELSDDVSYEITLNDLPEAKYYALGHIHNFKVLKLDNGSYVVYPGSTERFDSREASLFLDYEDDLKVLEGSKKGFVLVENFEPKFVEVKTRRLVNIKISARKYSDVEKKTFEVVKLLKDEDLVVVKFLSEEELNFKRLADVLSKVKHFEVRFEKLKKDLEYVGVPKEEKFFTDFELKILEALKDFNEVGTLSAIEIIKSYFGLSETKKLDEVKDVTQPADLKQKKEVVKKVKRTLLDYLGD